MSVYRDNKSLDQEDCFTFDDSIIIDDLLSSEKLNESEKLALQRLYRTCEYLRD